LRYTAGILCVIGMPKRKKPESKEAVAARVRRYRERESAAQVIRWHTAQWLRATQQDRLPLAECQRRIADWEQLTGQNWLRSKELALTAWYRDVGLIATWRYPLLRRRVPAVRAANEVRSIPVTVELNRLYCGALMREQERWHRSGPGDWMAHTWDVSELSTWHCKVNRAFLKLPIPGAGFTDAR
jgi:hypothetical protein